MALPLADWLIAAAVLVLVAVTRLIARRHPKIPPAE